MNFKIWKKHQKTPLADAKKMLKESHSNVMPLIETFSNDELFAKGSLAWTEGAKRLIVEYIRWLNQDLSFREYRR